MASLIVIGAGPAGYETAVEAASRGLDVTLVTEGPLGGTCLNEGCIPTKTFCSCAAPGVSVRDVVERKNEVVERFRKGIESLMKQVRVIYGHATFLDSRTVEVGGEKLGADFFLIATGSLSSMLPIPGAELCLTSREILDIDELPESICIIGGGVVGLEFASVFASFGSAVTVLEYCPQLLPKFDSDISKRLKSALVRRGVNIITSASVESVSAEGSRHTVTYVRKEIAGTVEAGKVLMAVGRRPNVDGLGLDAAGVEYDRRGIAVGEDFRTNVPGIYAVGDVIGGVMLAHVASFEGRRALDSICGRPNSTDFSLIPSVVFTIPELATVGLSEEQCMEKGLSYEVRKSFYSANGKAVSMGESDGCCRILVDSGTGKLLGAHILGAHASDLIHEIVMIMAAGMTASRAASVIHAHPSLSEIVLAALR